MTFFSHIRSASARQRRSCSSQDCCATSTLCKPALAARLVGVEGPASGRVGAHSGKAGNSLAAISELDAHGIVHNRCPAAHPAREWIAGSRCRAPG